MSLKLAIVAEGFVAGFSRVESRPREAREAAICAARFMAFVMGSILVRGAGDFEFSITFCDERSGRRNRRFFFEMLKTE